MHANKEMRVEIPNSLVVDRNSKNEFGINSFLARIFWTLCLVFVTVIVTYQVEYRADIVNFSGKVTHSHRDRFVFFSMPR
jgi:hypothetical protein